jgi:hypothetical protein
MRLDDDSLDRAIAALPLEEPPADLRASILAATVYRPAPPFTAAELVAGAAFVGVMLWLVLGMNAGVSAALVQIFTHMTFLLWIGVGVAVTLSGELISLPKPAYAGIQRAKGRSKP